MAKPYEIHGIPDDVWPEYDAPPDYAIVYENDGVENPYGTHSGLIPGDVRLWGQVDYWTALEAALLMVGVSPNDNQLYAVSKENVEDIGYGTIYYGWKYAYEFDIARDYLFLFERSNLAPKAPPIEWVKLFNQKVRDASLAKPFEPAYCDDWVEFFCTELNGADQVENTLPSSVETLGRQDQQHEIILAVIAALKFNSQRIPDGGKSEIKAVCLTRHRLFTTAGFDHAWKAGVSAGLFKMANHEKFTSK